MTHHMATDLRAPLEAVVGRDHVRDDRGALLPSPPTPPRCSAGARTPSCSPARPRRSPGCCGSRTARRPGGPPRRRDEPVRGHRAAPRRDRAGAHPDGPVAGGQPGRLLARCEPGVPRALARRPPPSGLLFAPDPGSRTVSTVGGNVADLRGGLRGLKYGVTRNYVLGLEAVLPTGEVIRTGGRLWKDVAGYDLTRLLTGSEGTLGGDHRGDAGAAADAGDDQHRRRVLRRPGRREPRGVGASSAPACVPATLEFLDATCIARRRGLRAPGPAARRRRAAAVRRRRRAGRRSTRNLARMGELLRGRGRDRGDPGAAEVAESRGAARGPPLRAAGAVAAGLADDPRGRHGARPRLAEMVERIDAIAAAHDADDRHLRPRRRRQPAPDRASSTRHDDAAIERGARGLRRDLRRRASSSDGTITGEHGVGAAKLPYLRARLGADQMALLRRIKAAFDPAGILNPGKLGS